jgi:hypothetical protein
MLLGLLDGGKQRRIGGVQTLWMTESSGTIARSTGWIRGDIEDDVIGARGIARNPSYAGEVI